jgi:hypothetical protein
MVYGFDNEAKGREHGFCKGKYEYFAEIDGLPSGGYLTAGNGENELRFFAVNHYCTVEDAIKYNRKFAKHRLDIKRRPKNSTTVLEDLPIHKTIWVRGGRKR